MALAVYKVKLEGLYTLGNYSETGNRLENKRDLVMIAPIVISRAMKSYSVVRCYQTFGAIYCIHLQDRIIFGVGNLIAKYFIFWNFALCEIALYTDLPALFTY